VHSANNCSSRWAYELRPARPHHRVAARAADVRSSNIPVHDDVGLLRHGALRRSVSFKVPQLRRISQCAYFHDNSAETLEDVVDYFNSADYTIPRMAKFPITQHARAKAESALSRLAGAARRIVTRSRPRG